MRNTDLRILWITSELTCKEWTFLNFCVLVSGTICGRRLCFCISSMMSSIMLFRPWLIIVLLLLIMIISYKSYKKWLIKICFINQLYFILKKSLLLPMILWSQLPQNLIYHERFRWLKAQIRWKFAFRFCNKHKCTILQLSMMLWMNFITALKTTQHLGNPFLSLISSTNFPWRKNVKNMNC